MSDRSTDLNAFVAQELQTIKAGRADLGQFCKLWPTIKSGLELLEKIVKNPFLKLAIEALIKIGDGLCPGK